MPYAPPAYPATGPGSIYDPTPQPKSSVLGIVGLALVVIGGVIFFVNGVDFYKGVLQITGPLINGPVSVPSLTPEQQALLMGPIAGIGLSSLGGFAGLIVSIVATARNSGRAFGIVGIVLGVLAPFTIIIAAMVAIAGAQ